MGKIKYDSEVKLWYYDIDYIKGYEFREEINDNNDCSVRAIASATGADYREAHEYASKYFNRKIGEGAEGFGLIMDRRAGLPFLNNTKYKEIKLKEKRMLLKDFLEEYSSGIYIVCMYNHVFTVKNKIIIGNSDDRKMLTKKVHFVYKINKILNGKD